MAALPTSAATAGHVPTIDADPGSRFSDLSGTIDWGDGSTPTAATFTPGPEPGQWDVGGTYQWPQPGSYPVTITVIDTGGSETGFGDTVTVGPDTPSSGTSIVADAANGVNISQVYARGGQPQSVFAQDYIELVNTNTTPVSLSGWSLQYADVGSGSWQVAALAGTLQAGQYYLVQAQASGSSGLDNIPIPDLVSTFPLDPFGGKVALVNTTTPLSGPAPLGTNIIDFVGYGLADAYEGNAAAPATDPTTADVRGDAGFLQTEQNGVDFSAATPDPHNTASASANFPPVGTVPGAQWTPENTPLYFASASGNALSVADFDAGSNTVEVSLLADNGTVTLATLDGLTLVQGTGSGDTEVTFDGSLSAINAALDGLEFNPATDYLGPAVLAISTDDLGDSGGTDQTDIETVLIAVGGPVVAVSTTASTDENSPVAVDVLADDAYVVDSSQLSLSIVTGPADGQATVSTDSSGYSTITYAPDSYFNGTDSFVYQVTDGQGNSSEASVTVTVNPVNFAVINPPADQVNDEGDSISVQLQTPNNDGSVPLTFAAAGLPAGLSIDPNTGIISGIPLYTDAETNLGQYTVTVSASGPGTGDSDSEQFNWTINDTNRIGFIDDQVSEAGQLVNFQPVVQDNLGDPLTFNVSGLPAGLTFDPITGDIYGTPLPGTPGVTTSTVTYQVSGGGDTDTQTFNWNIVSGSGEYVFFSLNDTLNTSDDVGVVGQAVPVTVTFFDPGVPGAQSIYLQQPSGLASLSTNQLQLADGQSAEITLTPQQPSVQSDDVMLVAFNGPQFAQIIGQAALTAEQKFIITTGRLPGQNRIDALDTPSKMAPDRIPLRMPTSVTFKIPGAPLPKWKWFTITVLGQSNTTGRIAFIISAKQKWNAVAVATGTNFTEDIAGTSQTVPGNAGKLIMTVFAGDVDLSKADPAKALGKTDGFSVASIPISVTMSINNPMQAVRALDNDGNPYYQWGVKYKVAVASDSGPDHFGDLNQVKVSEIIVPQKGATGALAAIFKEGKVVVGPWNSLSDPKIAEILFDRHVWRQGGASRREAVINANKLILADGAGKGDLFQYVKFLDARTGITDPKNAVVVPNSGFKIHFEIDPLSEKLMRWGIIQVKKTPLKINSPAVAPGIMAGADQAQKTVEIK